MRSSLIFFLIFFLSCSYNKNNFINKAFRDTNSKYLIYINKKLFILEIIDRNFNIRKNYIISYGKNPDMKPKLHENDNRTPEGLYIVREILSMNSPKKSEAYKKLKKLNDYYFKAKNGFYKCGNKKIDQGNNVYGPRFYYINYPNEQDRINYKDAVRSNKVKKINGKTPGIGFGIAIHGTNEPDSMGKLCSMGCVRMKNADIIELDDYIKIGTPVIVNSK